MKMKTSSGKDIFENNLEKKKEEIAYNKRLLDFSVTIKKSLYCTPEIFYLSELKTFTDDVSIICIT